MDTLMTPLTDRARRAAGLGPGDRGRLLEELIGEVERLAAELARVTAERDRAYELERRRWEKAAGVFGAGVRRGEGETE